MIKYLKSIANEKNLAFSLAALLLLSAGAALLPGLSSDIFRFDDFYSIERSSGFDKHGDWLTVYTANEPSFRKPPLQYWLNAVNLRSGMPMALAIRLWSYIFLLALLAASALTCYYLCRENAWSIPAGVVLFCSSTIMLQLGCTGLLDIGMSFFIMASLLAFLYAKENPKAWVFCGLFIGLGTLQKAPVAPLFVGILFAFSSMRGDPVYRWSTVWRDKYFKAGFYLALILILSWPVIQTIKYGTGHFEIMYQQMWVRFSPVDLAPEKQKSILGHFMWLKWLWSDMHILGVLSGLCVLSVFYFKKWRNNRELSGICLLIVITSIALSLATGEIYARYLAVLLPLLVCVNVKVLNDVLSWRPGVFVASIFFAALLPGNIVDRFNPINPVKHAAEGHKLEEITELISTLDRYVRKNDRIVIDTAVIPEGAYAYFGNDPKGYYTLRVLLRGRLERNIESGNSSLVGIARLSNRDAIEKIVGPVETLEITGSNLIWRDETP